MRRRNAFAVMGCAYVALFFGVFLIALTLLTRPDALGFVREDDFNATGTALGSEFVVFERTALAYEVLATRAFNLNLTLEIEREELEATATQSADDFSATGTAIADDLDASQATISAGAESTLAALSLTEQAGVQIAFDNIAERATLEYNQAVFAVEATSAAEQFALTASALSARVGELNQREAAFASSQTQVALDSVATMTQIAAQNEQEATRSAIDFAATQSAFEIESASIEEAFQGTQAAISADATALALDFATSAPPADLEGAAEPTLSGVPFTSDGAFISDAGARWTPDDPTAWALDAGGTIRARDDGAILRSEAASIRDYTLQLTIDPPVAGDYYALIRIPSNGGRGLALRLVHDGERLTTATVIQFDADDLSDGGLIGNGAGVLFSATPQNITSFDLRVAVFADQIVITMDGETLFQTALDGLGVPSRVGVQLPADARLDRLVLTPE